MVTQSEQILENNLLEQLKTLGYSYISLNHEKDLLDNLKRQLEIHNNTTFSAKEFEKVMNILSKGSVFEKAKTLREEKHLITLDNGDNFYIGSAEKL